MDIFEELQERGLIAQVTDNNEIRDLINKGWIVKYNREEGKQKYLNKKQ